MLVAMAVEIRDVPPGLWLWRQPHPDWREGSDWEPEVASSATSTCSCAGTAPARTGRARLGVTEACIARAAHAARDARPAVRACAGPPRRARAQPRGLRARARARALVRVPG